LDIFERGFFSMYKNKYAHKDKKRARDWWSDSLFHYLAELFNFNKVNFYHFYFYFLYCCFLSGVSMLFLKIFYNSWDLMCVLKCKFMKENFMVHVFWTSFFGIVNFCLSDCFISWFLEKINELHIMLQWTHTKTRNELPYVIPNSTKYSSWL
jgi:hypothetical protein